MPTPSDASQFALAMLTRAQALYTAGDADGMLPLAAGIPADGRLPGGITLSPAFVAAVAGMLHNLSFACRDAGRYDAALACSGEACRLQPTDGTFHLHRMYLLLGRRAYRDAWNRADWQRALRDAHPALWDGISRVDGLLVNNSNGLGDFIQFLRFIPEAARRAGRVYLETPPGTKALFRHTPLPDGVTLIDSREGISFEATCEMVCLPFAMGLGAEDIATPGAYLHAPPERTGPWRDVVAAHGEGIPIGLVWASWGDGNPRSLPFAALRPLLEIPGLRVFGLQNHKDKAALHGQALPDHFTDLGVYDTRNMAAIMRSMRLVIAPDCGLAHLAAALGVETWLCLARVGDWRWGENGERGDWYPNVRMFRQSQAGDGGSDPWAPVIAGIAERLRTLTA